MNIHNGNIMDISDIENHSFLQINSCGIQIQSYQEKLTYRKNGRQDYHIVYISEGTAEIEYMGKITLISHGFALYPPHVPQRYIEHVGTKKLWLHFNGYYVEEILKDARLECGVHYLAPSPICEKIFIEMVTEHNQMTGISNEKGLLLTFLSTLGRLTNHIASTNESIDKVISFITTHYNATISIQELADSCGLSLSHFLFLFKERAGQSPHAYQQTLRINNCMSLLASTQLSVSDISALAGYQDPLYFSRLFRKKVGMSPSQYRQMFSEGQD